MSSKNINTRIVTLIKNANDNERSTLLSSIGNRRDKATLSPEQIFDELFRSEYLDSLKLVAKKLEISFQENKNWNDMKNVVELEDDVLRKILKLSYENMSKDERAEFDVKVREIASQQGISSQNIIGAAGLMTVANLGGFSTYMLMSSFLSVISFGTLGFGAYTAASSLLSTIIGPVGWAALGIYAVYKWTRPDFKKLIPAVITVAMISKRLEYEKHQKRLAMEKRRLAEKERAIAERKRRRKPLGGELKENLAIIYRELTSDNIPFDRVVIIVGFIAFAISTIAWFF